MGMDKIKKLANEKSDNIYFKYKVSMWFNRILIVLIVLMISRSYMS